MVELKQTGINTIISDKNSQNKLDFLANFAGKHIKYSQLEGGKWKVSVPYISKIMEIKEVYLNMRSYYDSYGKMKKSLVEEGFLPKGFNSLEDSAVITEAEFTMLRKGEASQANPFYEELEKNISVKNDELKSIKKMISDKKMELLGIEEQLKEKKLELLGITSDISSKKAEKKYEMETAKKTEEAHYGGNVADSKKYRYLLERSDELVKTTGIKEGSSDKIEPDSEGYNELLKKYEKLESILSNEKKVRAKLIRDISDEKMENKKLKDALRELGGEKAVELALKMD